MLKNLKLIFNKKNNYIITTHIFPDGDALGSVYALFIALKQKKFKVKILIDNKFSFIPFNIKNSTINNINKNTYIIVVDANDILRTPKKVQNLKLNVSKLVFIDHHSPILEHKESFYYINKNASSTGELIYVFLKKYLKIKFNTEIAKGIYTALIADTRSFKYSRTTALAHKIAYHFIKNNLIKPEEIQNKFFDNKKPSYLKFIGYILSNFKLNKKIAYIVIDDSILKKFKVNKSELKSSFNILFSISKIVCIMLIYKKNNNTEFFIKSKKILNFNDFSKYKPLIKKYSCTFKILNHNNINNFIKKIEKILKS